MMKSSFLTKDKDTNAFKIIEISTNNGLIFGHLTFNMPIRINKNNILLNFIFCEFEFDVKYIPGFYFSLYLFGLELYFRYNNAKNLELFNKWDKEIEEAKAHPELLKTFDDLLKNK